MSGPNSPTEEHPVSPARGVPGPSRERPRIYGRPWDPESDSVTRGTGAYYAGGTWADETAPSTPTKGASPQSGIPLAPSTPTNPSTRLNGTSSGIQPPSPPSSPPLTPQIERVPSPAQSVYSDHELDNLRDRLRQRGRDGHVMTMQEYLGYAGGMLADLGPEKDKNVALAVLQGLAHPGVRYIACMVLHDEESLTFAKVKSVLLAPDMLQKSYWTQNWGGPGPNGTDSGGYSRGFMKL